MHVSPRGGNWETIPPPHGGNTKIGQSRAQFSPHQFTSHTLALNRSIKHDAVETKKTFLLI